MSRLVENLSLAAVTSLVVAAPAWGGMIPPGVPAPVVGLGIPALAAFGLLYRRMRKRGDNQE